MNTLTNPARRPTGVGAAFRRTGRRLWQALEAQGQDRAQRHLLDFARQCEPHQPELARALRAAGRAIV